MPVGTGTSDPMQEDYWHARRIGVPFAPGEVETGTSYELDRWQRLIIGASHVADCNQASRTEAEAPIDPHVRIAVALVLLARLDGELLHTCAMTRLITRHVWLRPHFSRAPAPKSCEWPSFECQCVVRTVAGGKPGDETRSGPSGGHQ